MIVRLGDMPAYCAPDFVGPLSEAESASCEGWTLAGNLQAGVNYRDALLAGSASPAKPFDFSGKMLGFIVAGIFVFALISGGRR